MIRYITRISALAGIFFMATSCESYLEEEPKTFLSPDFYFQSESQILAAVNGVYTFMDDRLDGDLAAGSQTYLLLEYMHGYGEKVNGSGGNLGINQSISLSIADNNQYVERLWASAYWAIENCNSILEGMEGVSDEIIAPALRDKYLGEIYFLRAYSYFNLVRLFGPVPLKTSSTKNLAETEIELAPVDAVYAQIEEDLLKADALMSATSWGSVEGRVSKGAVKTLLAKVYLTMAGFPLQKGDEYYQRAVAQASAVVSSGAFYLFDEYSDLRDMANENMGEYILMIQREAQNAGSPVHTNMLPYPEPDPAISANGSFGGALAPAQSFFDSYSDGDLRTEEKAFYYSEHETLDNPDATVTFARPFIYKFWDQQAAETGNSGRNYPLLTYADLLLTLAEAQARLDGGTTNNTAAIDAYYEVRGRANPSEPKPGTLTTDEVLRERFWELAFEGHTWYDMLRTRKAFNPITGNIVDLIGYRTPGHPEGIVFQEQDLLLPYPAREKRLNPNLVRN